jgi:hypothetical protein
MLIPKANYGIRRIHDSAGLVILSQILYYYSREVQKKTILNVNWNVKQKKKQKDLLNRTK